MRRRPVGAPSPGSGTAGAPWAAWCCGTDRGTHASGECRRLRHSARRRGGVGLGAAGRAVTPGAWNAGCRCREWSRRALAVAVQCGTARSGRRVGGRRGHGRVGGERGQRGAGPVRALTRLGAVSHGPSVRGKERAPDRAGTGTAGGSAGELGITRCGSKEMNSDGRNVGGDRFGCHSRSPHLPPPPHQPRRRIGRTNKLSGTCGLVSTRARAPCRSPCRNVGISHTPAARRRPALQYGASWHPSMAGRRAISPATRRGSPRRSPDVRRSVRSSRLE